MRPASILAHDCPTSFPAMHQYCDCLRGRKVPVAIEFGTLPQDSIKLKPGSVSSLPPPWPPLVHRVSDTMSGPHMTPSGRFEAIGIGYLGVVATSM